MVAFNFHQKLLEDSINATASATVAVQSCTIQCDPQKNPAALCTFACSSICPSFCRTIDSSPPLSSPQLPPTHTYVPSSLSPPLDHHHHSPFSLTITISLVVLVLTFSLFLLYTLYKFYTVWYRSRRRRSPPPPSPGNQETHDEFIDHEALDHPIWYIRTIGLQPSVISAITVMKYSKGEGLVDGTDCSVCLSEFQEDETLRLLPKCNHAFHISCIDTWLRSHTNCPLCRAGIVKSTVDSPSPEQNTSDSGPPVEETHITISIPEEDVEGSELRIRADEEDLNDKAAEVFDERSISDFLNMRRSVSLDESSDNYPEINGIQVQSIEGDLGTELVKVDQTTDNQNQNKNQSLLRLVGSSSIGRSLQISPSFMRRSISCNGNILPSRHSSRSNNPSS